MTCDQFDRLVGKRYPARTWPVWFLRHTPTSKVGQIHPTIFRCRARDNTEGRTDPFAGSALPHRRATQLRLFTYHHDAEVMASPAAQIGTKGQRPPSGLSEITRGFPPGPS